MEDADDPGIVRDELEQSLGAAKRGENLVRQLLAVGRKQVMSPQVIDVGVALQESCGLLSRLLGHGIKLEQRYCDERLFVEIDPNQFAQIILNLAVNARDAMPDGGTLTVASSLQQAHGTGGEHVVIQVTDTGIGMSDEVLTRLFEPFFSTKDRQSGTGLGLAMVHGIVAQSGGEISVESVLGEGTTFTLVLRRVAAPEKAVTPSRDVAEVTGGSVLLVEDDLEVRRALVSVLRRHGFHVTATDSLEATMRALDESLAFSALVSDVNLPGVSGVRIAAAVRERMPDVPVVFISGNPGDLLDEFEEAPEQIRFLQKPFLPATLVQEVASAVSGASN